MLWCRVLQQCSGWMSTLTNRSLCSVPVSMYAAFNTNQWGRSEEQPGNLSGAVIAVVEHCNWLSGWILQLEVHNCSALLFWLLQFVFQESDHLESLIGISQ